MLFSCSDKYDRISILGLSEQFREWELLISELPFDQTLPLPARPWPVAPRVSFAEDAPDENEAWTVLLSSGWSTR